MAAGLDNLTHEMTSSGLKETGNEFSDILLEKDEEEEDDDPIPDFFKHYRPLTPYHERFPALRYNH